MLHALGEVPADAAGDERIEVREPELPLRRLHDDPQDGQPTVDGGGRVVARTNERPHALTPRLDVGDIELVDEELAEPRHEQAALALRAADEVRRLSLGQRGPSARERIHRKSGRRGSS